MNCVDVTNSASGSLTWQLPTTSEVGALPMLSRSARVMAIINTTPDSFSDGGLHDHVDAAYSFAQSAIAAGADFLDIGGESTRPGSHAVDVDTELQRVLPLIERLSGQSAISIDTQKALVAQRAFDAGARIVNDVSAGRDPEMFPLVADRHAPIVLMHMQGSPEHMQDNPHYESVIDDLCHFFHERMQAAISAGINEEAIILDPGIGFGKTLEQNLLLLQNLRRFHDEFNRPLLIGLSRKSLLPKIMGRDKPAHERDAWSHLLHAQLAQQCSVLRVHDVVGCMDALAAARALQNDHSSEGCH